MRFASDKDFRHLTIMSSVNGVSLTISSGSQQ